MVQMTILTDCFYLCGFCLSLLAWFWNSGRMQLQKCQCRSQQAFREFFFLMTFIWVLGNQLIFYEKGKIASFFGIILKRDTGVWKDLLRINSHVSETGFFHCQWLLLLVAQSCLTLWDPMDCSTPGLPVLHYLPEFAQTHVHWISDAIQPSNPL